MPSLTKQLMSAALAAVMLAGCANGHKDDRTVEQQLQRTNGARYTSAQVEGAAARINLDEVKKAFWDTQGADMDTAMKNFEQRVNEIYGGKEIVAVDAAKQGTGVMVVGFIDKNGQPGFQTGDDRLFVIEQTGQAANDQVPYRMSNGDGTPYYNGTQVYHHHDGGGGAFFTGLLLGHIIGGWGHYGGHYYTPYSHYHSLTVYRTTYRSSPAYHTQMASNRAFDTRFKSQAPGGGVSSNRRFGSGGFSSGSNGTNGTGGTSSSRRWGGPTGGNSGGTTATSGTSSTSNSSWSGRRSTSSTSTGSSSGSSSSGWSGRRSSSSSSTSSSSRRRR
ncbi:MAG: hypothetical protein JWM80_5379 [Cyanobacteria bacterium RYN_339]|nr:hypothetical protein [Cyanobacteria bacterium RYN_339]